MRFEFFGLSFDTPRLTFYLWSPWRAAALEHRLFDALRALPRVEVEQGPDEMRLHITEGKTCKSALQVVARVLMGWQEDAEPGNERRSWRWLLEGDTDSHGYDHTGEPFALWGFLRVSLERGIPGEMDAPKVEDIDLEGFGFQVEAGSSGMP
jgi:hypothetical protein